MTMSFNVEYSYTSFISDNALLQYMMLILVSGLINFCYNTYVLGNEYKCSCIGLEFNSEYLK